MAIRFIRKPSETPNISNADDTRLLRYALGDYNGYIKGKGAELSYTINGSIFIINSGIVVLQGYDVEVDANGWELAVDNVATKRYFSVYLEVNLASQTADIKSMYDTAGYPTIASGDDLTASSTGTARLLLYTFSGQSGVIAEVSKKVTEIKYSKTLIAEEATTRTTEDAKKLDKSGHPAFRVMIINDRGNVATTPSETANSVVLGNGSTVEIAESVTSGLAAPVTSRAVYTAIQGVKNITSATISSSVSLSVATVKRQVNFVIGRIARTENGEYGIGTITVPSGYRPKSTQAFHVRAQMRYYVGTTLTFGYSHVTMTIATNGAVTFSNYGLQQGSLAGFDIIFAYEIT